MRSTAAVMLLALISASCAAPKSGPRYATTELSSGLDSGLGSGLASAQSSGFGIVMLGTGAVAGGIGIADDNSGLMIVGGVLLGAGLLLMLLEEGLDVSQGKR